MINGQFQPQGDKSFEKLILQIVQTIPRYIFIYKAQQNRSE